MGYSGNKFEIYNKTNYLFYLRLAHACLGSKLLLFAGLEELEAEFVNRLLKHVLQYTGLFGVGLKGTVVAWPQPVHLASNKVLCDMIYCSSHYLVNN
jgi:hypothetical protein